MEINEFKTNLATILKQARRLRGNVYSNLKKTGLNQVNYIVNGATEVCVKQLDNGEVHVWVDLDTDFDPDFKFATAEQFFAQGHEYL